MLPLLSIVIHSAAAGPPEVTAEQPSAALLAALQQASSARVGAVLETGLDPWPTLVRLRAEPDLGAAVRPLVQIVIDATRVTPSRAAVSGRSELAPPSWLEERLVAAVPGPFLCAALDASDAWLANQALARGETYAACPTTDPCALSAAVASDDVAAATVLLARGASARHGCGLTPLWSARSASMVSTLLRSGLDPFLPSLQIEDHLRQTPHLVALLIAPTAFPERRDELVAWAWVAGVARPDDLVPWIPRAFRDVPHAATPNLGRYAFGAGWTAAGSAARLVAAAGGRLGDPLQVWPCARPAGLPAAKSLIGPLDRTHETPTHRHHRGPGGTFEQRQVGGRWQTMAWSVAVDTCAELSERVPYLPARLGPGPWITVDGVLFDVRDGTLSAYVP